eukprot:5138970-Pyramimonas_sp.AAC.1
MAPTPQSEQFALDGEREAVVACCVLTSVVRAPPSGVGRSPQGLVARRPHEWRQRGRRVALTTAPWVPVLQA